METRLPLEGIKAIDFGWVATEPIAMRYLAHHGTTVIRLESHTRLETLRTSGPFRNNISGVDRGGQFTNNNSSKYGASLDMTKPGGRELAIKFIMWADIVSEGFSPRAMKNLKLDYETVSKLKPDIIYLSTSQQGHSGPRAMVAGYGTQLAALTGMHYISGWPDRQPSPPYGAYTDYICPHFEVAVIMAALDYRRRTGKGLYIDQSQFETGAHFIAPPIMDYFVNGRVMGRNGNRLPYAAPHSAYPCQGNDRWVAIAVFTDEEWQAFSRVVGNPEWTKDPKFATLLGRKENEDELDRLVGKWTVGYPAEKVEAMMQAAGVAANVVESNKDLFEDPQLQHRGYLQYLEHPVIGRHAYESPAFRLSKSPFRMFPSPCLGQHNEYVYKEILGLSDDEIGDLYAEGVITTEANLPEWRPAY